MKNKHLNFIVDRGRKIVVSLGGKRCPLNCAHCYTFAPDFKFFPSKNPDELISDLLPICNSDTIVYLSGDIEPFLAESKALKFLELMASNTDVDLLFTTRLSLSESTIDSIAQINEIQIQKNRLLIGSVSIPALESYQRIETAKMVPTPYERVELLKKLLSIPIPTMVAIRPIFPTRIINPGEYRRLISLISTYSTIIVGELLFLDTEGILENRLGISVSEEEYFEGKMSFLAQDRKWKVCKWDSQIQVIRDECKKHDKAFYMRSMPGIELIRKYWNPQMRTLSKTPIYPLTIQDYDDQLF